ncbi:MAG: outer membrane lipoprotein-sorting protein [Chlamydiota bacterium]|nr:outer membrane lipoprotein-sorting protein [Chlamydiota bacterium]
MKIKFKIKTTEMLVTILLMAFILPLSGNTVCYGSELTAKEIVKKSQDLVRGETNYGVYELTVKTPDWERTLTMEGWDKRPDYMFLRIINPPKEAGTTFLRIGTNMWQYIPKVERVIKFPPSMMMQSWMGSDFNNDDLVKESSMINDYHHRVIRKDMEDGEEFYEIELLPKPDAPVVWGKIIYRVRIQDFVPLKEEFYSEKGVLKRVMHYKEIRLMDDRNIPTVIEVKSLSKPGNVTVLHITAMQFNESFDENIFTMRNLKNQR